jgi:hypothetical protein
MGSYRAMEHGSSTLEMDIKDTKSLELDWRRLCPQEQLRQSLRRQLEDVSEDLVPSRKYAAKHAKSGY